MRNMVFCVILIFLSGTAIANDSWVSATGGAVSTMTSEHESIQLVRERVAITLHDNYYSVIVSSVFYNFGATTTIQIGFPEFAIEMQDAPGFRNFETEVNGKKLRFQKKKAVVADSSWTRYWYVKDVQFPKSAYTTTTIKYSTSYGRAGSYYTAEYLFGTGLTWKGEIKEVDFVVQNEAEKWIDMMWEDVGDKRYSGLQMTDRHFLNAVDRNTFRISMFNIEPLSLQDSITILFHSVDVPHPFYNPPFATQPTDYYFDKKPMSSFHLNVLTKKQHRIVRNLIYAWHGYSFRSPDLQSLFASQNWYTVNPDFSESEFNQQEKMNIKTILEEEILREAEDLSLQ